NGKPVGCVFASCVFCSKCSFSRRGKLGCFLCFGCCSCGVPFMWRHHAEASGGRCTGLERAGSTVLVDTLGDVFEALNAAPFSPFLEHWPTNCQPGAFCCLRDRFCCPARAHF
ncbi:unnamed protein product, partial [Phaeothamnion confervicola]